MFPGVGSCRVVEAMEMKGDALYHLNEYEPAAVASHEFIELCQISSDDCEVFKIE